MWELDHKKGWSLRNWCFQIVVLKKSLDSPLDSMEIKSANPKGNQAWIFIVRTDAEAEAPIPRPPDAKSWLIGKDCYAGKDWGQEKGVTEDEWLDSITDSMDMTLSKLQEIIKDREAWHATVHGVSKSWKQLSNWTTTRYGWISFILLCISNCYSTMCWKDFSLSLKNILLDMRLQNAIFSTSTLDILIFHSSGLHVPKEKFISERRKWQPTPVLLLGKSHG